MDVSRIQRKIEHRQRGSSVDSLTPVPSESPPDTVTLPKGMVSPMPPTVNPKTLPPDADIEPISRSSTAPEERMPHPKNAHNGSVERYTHVPVFVNTKYKRKVKNNTLMFEG